MNRYTYCFNMPMVLVDLNGKVPKTTDELISDLNNAVDSYINVGQKIKTKPYNTNEEAMNIVLENDSTITKVANKYNVDKAMIQSIIFQETRFYGIDDPVADSLVIQSYAYEQQLEDYVNWINNLKWYEMWKGIFRQPPQPVLGYRTDSSTGLGQIFARTAINAYNEEKHTSYDASDWKDLKKFWEYLQDDENNIEMVALVLKNIKNQKELSGKTLKEIEKIMSSYNGEGDWAQKYGAVTIQYYQAFRKYNECGLE